MIRLMVFFLLAGFVSIAGASIQPRIIGGKIAATGSWPSAVRLQVGPFLCGGNLIAPNWVLTAAHCFVDKDGVQEAYPADVLVLAGEQDFGAMSSSNVITVRAVWIHPNFDFLSLNADIALLELSELTNLPTMSFDGNPSVGEFVTAVGWGTTKVDPNTGEPVPGTTSSKLLQVSMPIVSNQVCNTTYSDGITNLMLCAGFEEGGKDSCTGDSGGPLMVQAGGGWKQAGVVSFGAGCAQPKAYGVYTRVAAFTNWINTTMAGGDSTDPGITEVKPPQSGAGSTSTSGGDSGGAAGEGSGGSGASGGGGGAMFLELLALLLLFGLGGTRRDKLRNVHEIS